MRTLTLLTLMFIGSSAFASYCNVEYSNPDGNEFGLLSGYCVIHEWHDSIPHGQPYMEVLIENSEGSWKRIFAKDLKRSARPDPKRPPKFVDPENDGVGTVTGKFPTPSTHWKGPFVRVIVFVDGDRFVLHER